MSTIQARTRSLAGLRAAEVEFRFSPAAQAEMLRFAATVSDLEAVEATPVRPDDLPAFAPEVELLRTRLEEGIGLALVQPLGELPYPGFCLVGWTMANLLGTPLVQNEEGMRVVNVYDRDRTKRMAQGARYHQTREGGSIHTDNVNIPEPWEYLLFSCYRQALVGGESILVSAGAVHDYLEREIPEVLEALRQPFWWEYRGIADKLYQAPVITYDDRVGPCFRYLRPYLESAHKKAEEPLTERQVWALDVLDAVMDLSEMQFRHRLRPGETLLTYDSQVLHGRTSFTDAYHTVNILEADSQPDAVVKRTISRLWIRK